MIYKIHTNNGERYSIEADYFKSDGSGVSLYTDEGGIAATFYSGEVTRIFPESAIVEAETEVVEGHKKNGNKKV